MTEPRMSILAPLTDRHPDALPSGRSLPRLRELVVRPFRAASFWSAVLLPLLYLPLLATGLDTIGRASLFVAMVTLHLLALVVGHSYSPD